MATIKPQTRHPGICKVLRSQDKRECQSPFTTRQTEALNIPSPKVFLASLTTNEYTNTSLRYASALQSLSGSTINISESEKEKYHKQSCPTYKMQVRIQRNGVCKASHDRHLFVAPKLNSRGVLILFRNTKTGMWRWKRASPFRLLPPWQHV